MDAHAPGFMEYLYRINSHMLQFRRLKLTILIAKVLQWEELFSSEN